MFQNNFAIKFESYLNFEVSHVFVAQMRVKGCRSNWSPYNSLMAGLDILLSLAYITLSPDVFMTTTDCKPEPFSEIDPWISSVTRGAEWGEGLKTDPTGPTNCLPAGHLISGNSRIFCESWLSNLANSFR
jgi:hypothetical protein